jgi:Hypothetical protein (DUF2513)
MKRDLDLCREILRQIADSPSLNAPIEIAVERRSDDEITYQLHIMTQEGLIEAVKMTSLSGMAYKPFRLTWKGNEFLDAARDDKIWNRTKARFIEAGGALTFDLVLEILKEGIRNQIGLGGP